MGHLFGLLLVPAIVCGILAYVFKATITLKEFALMLGIAMVVALTGFFLARWGAMQDTENWNGRITSKDHGSEKCCHCHEECDTCTRSNSKGGTETYSCRCREVCSHSRDYYWALTVSTGDNIPIDNCEPDEDAVPVAWAQANVGDPASIPHTYTNYLKADPDSLLLEGADAPLMSEVPNFPQVHDFYRVDKVVSNGVNVPPDWQHRLMELNADLGSRNQVDVTMVFTTNADPTYAQAVEAKWLYGPKNAVIIVVGVPTGDTFAWVRVVTLSKVEDLKVALRDQLQGRSIQDSVGGVGIVRREISERFTRTPMSEWEYLASAACPSTGMLVFLYILLIGGSLGLGAWMHREDVFGEERVRGFGQRVRDFEDYFVRSRR